MLRFILFISIFNLACISSQSIKPQRRFEYKYSFKGPYLAQKDNQVPFWTYSGNTIASSESLRITPSLRSQKGQAWSKFITDFDWWEVEIVFKVNGRGRIGADGLAFWYTTTPGVEGPVFGSSDKWNGLGLFFDSFDNDNKKNNPYIGLMVNDGTMAYDHENDGATQFKGGCLKDFRNKPHNFRAKLEYHKNILTLLTLNGLTASEDDYEICARVEGVYLPPRGYFGLTAATGGLADDHDVFKFLTTSLHEVGAGARVNVEEEEKFQKEFLEYQEKTKRAREEYVASNPDAAKLEQDDLDEAYGGDQELSQIFQGQSQIFTTVRQLHSKMDEILGRQERALSLVGSVHSLVSGGGVPPAATGGSQPSGSSIARHEVDQIMNTQREVSQVAREIKNMVQDIQAKSSQLLKQPVGSAQPVGGSYDNQGALRDLAAGVDYLKHNMPKGGAPQSSCPSCVGVTALIGVAVTQLVVILGYMFFRDNKDAQAKKFY